MASMQREVFAKRIKIWSIGSFLAAGLLATFPKHVCSQEPTAADYEKLCRIMGSEALKRIAPPFPESRMAYYLEKDKRQAAAIPRGPDNIYFRWKQGKLTRWGMSFGSGQGANLTTVIRMLTNVFPQDILGADDLRKLRAPGDFIVNVDASPERIIQKLEQILREELREDIRVSFRLHQREVYVARGKYEFKPIDKKRKRVEIYGAKLNRNPSLGGGGSGRFDKFLKWVGMWIEQPVISEVAKPPKNRISWHYNLDSPFTDEEYRAAKDPKAVLQHLTEQTGLTFTQEKRKVKVLMIERDDEK